MSVDCWVWSCCAVPVNVGNPRTVDAVDNTSDADRLAVAAVRTITCSLYKVLAGCAVDAWCITVYSIVRAHALFCVVDRTVVDQRHFEL